jgi:hypothetical protein
VTYIGAPYQERAAAMLVAGIRKWAGEYRDCPVYVVVTDPSVTGSRLDGLNATLVPLKLDGAIRDYPFAEKAFAAAEIEGLLAGKAGTLAWFDPQTLVLGPPSEMDLTDGFSAAVAPVQFVNAGQAPDEPVDAFWGPIYERCGLTDLGRLFPVETKVDGRTVRAWLNCGMFAVRPDRGLCREWAAILGGFLRDADYQRTAVTDAVRRTFLHQAVISALVVARLRRGEIRMLSSGYNYPLFCHGLDFKTASGAFRIPADKKASRLEDLTSVFLETLVFQRPDWLDLVPPAGEALRTWLTEAARTYIRSK